MSAAAAKRTVLAAVSVALLGAVSIAGSAGGASPAKRDRVPPSPPSNLHVATATPSLVTAAWDPAQDDVGVAGYYVYGDTGRAAVASTSYTVSSLGCGESGGVSVAAYDRAGNRSPRVTATISTAPCPDTQPPSTPSGFRQAATTQDAVVLGWNASSDDVGVVEYGVYRNLTRVASPVEPTVTLSGLTCDSTYSYTVDAVDGAGNRSPLGTAYVQTASCGDGQPPSVPTNLAVTSRSTSSLSVSWSPSNDDVGVTGYRVSVGGAPAMTISQPSATLAGLKCGTSYVIGVDAVDAAGNRSTAIALSASTDACPPPPPSGDTTPPSTPTGLAASSVSRTGLTLNWNPSGDNVGILGYDIYRSGTQMATVTSTSSSQTGLSCGTSYGFAVVARDAAGNSSQQAQLDASTSPCSAPPPPTGDTSPPSQPSNLGIASVTRASVSLTWGLSTDNVGVAGYRTYVNGAPGSTSAQLNSTISSLTCGTAYTFEVDAYDAASNRSTKASAIGSTATCPDTQAPTTPTNVVATSRTATSIALSWSASTDNVGVSGYGLYRGGAPVGSSPSTTGIFSGLACNTNHTLAVDAYDSAGSRSSQTVVMVSTTACPDTAPPSAPTLLAASNITQSGLTLTWSASTDNVGVTGYRVFSNGSQSAQTTSTSAAVSGLSCGTSYSVGVEAFDAAGNVSSRSTAAMTTSACSTPPPPSSGTVLDGFADMSAPWGGNLINRWQVPLGSSPWSAPSDTGTPWSSGGGMWETSTPHGPGFKFIVTDQMKVASGGKMALVADVDHLTDQQSFLGNIEDWSARVMFPAAGNPNGFPDGASGLIWEWHTQSMSGNHISIDPATRKLSFGVFDPASQWYRRAYDSSPVRYDHWYSWRIRLKWSYGSDGFFEGWIDGVKIADFTGATLKSGETPYLQFGFYAHDQLRNEAWHTDIRRS